MYLIERGYCIILLVKDKIDCNEAGHLEQEMSMMESVDGIILLAQDEIQNVISWTSTACRRDVSVRNNSLYCTVSTRRD